MICAIHQPQYLPWLGYLSKLDAADVFVIYDDTQYKHDEWQNRNRIRTATGVQWLTVPVHHSQGELIRDVAIDNSRPWARKHANALSTHYGRTTFYKENAREFQNLYAARWERLADLNLATIELLCRLLGIDTRIVHSSELKYEGRATDALISICRNVGADTYLSGPGGRDYLEAGKFSGQSGVALCFHDFDHPTYAQSTARGADFVPCLSAVDLLFNCGPDSPDVLRSGRCISSQSEAECQKEA